ncbi:hypothetical protein ACFCV3_22100 [Kribbella sp. NPDC056345]|uniref:hypothetical protein n=1 Tax=Kribbella sp. NPDC056345 TaxID=3345789 RepID=UPI0035DC8776
MATEGAPEADTRTAADYGKVADSLRNRVDLFGKTLAGFATIATGAVGLTTLSNLVPEDATPHWLRIGLAVAGLLLAAFGAITLAVLLMKAGDAAVVEVEKLGLTEDEKRLIDPIFTEAARRFGLSSLGALDEKEISLRRSAARMPVGDTRKFREERALEIRTQVELALARSQVAVVRRRASSAVSGTLAKCCYAFVAVGLVVFALAADASSQNRSDQIATAKACAEARKAGATVADGLDVSGCLAVAPTPAEAPAKPSSQELRADIVLRLGELLTVCEKGSVSNPETAAGSVKFGPGDCQAIKDALTAILQGSQPDK